MNYTSLPIVSTPLQEIRMNFVLGLSGTHRDYDSIFMVVYNFSKMTHFISCHKLDNASYILKPLLKEVIGLHGLPKIVLYRC